MTQMHMPVLLHNLQKIHGFNFLHKQKKDTTTTILNMMHTPVLLNSLQGVRPLVMVAILEIEAFTGPPKFNTSLSLQMVVQVPRLLAVASNASTSFPSG